MTHGSGEDMEKKKKVRDKNQPAADGASAKENEQPEQQQISEAERLLMQRSEILNIHNRIHSFCLRIHSAKLSMESPA